MCRKPRGGRKRKKGTALCRITAVFYRGNMEGVGRGETFRGFDSGCGIEYNGKSCARPRRPPERGGARRRTGRSSQK